MKFSKSVLNFSIAAALAALTGNAAASGFALIEQGSGLGNAFAGGAASAEDATTIFFNPAGMSRLSGKQLSVGGAFIKPSAKFSGTGGIGGDAGGEAGSLAFVPNAYFSMEASPKMKLGVGINAPFGMQTEYTPTWTGRAQGIKSRIETINLNPSLAYQVSDSLSLGAGINFQQIKGELTSFAGAAGTARITGSDTAWGYNLGAMYEMSPTTRLGMAYRSAIGYRLTGNATFSVAAVANTPVTLDIKMPDSFSFSAFHQLSESWDVMADATWTGWSVLKELRVVRPNGTTVSATPENWSDTWRISTGASYHYNDQWTARTGVALDQSPVADTYRTVRIPDASRTWLSIGGQYKPSKSDMLDFGYAHLFVSKASMNQNATANPDLIGKGFLVGSYSNSVDIMSVQYAHSF